MEQFAIGSLDALIDELLRAGVPEDLMVETLRMLRKVQLNPYHNAYAIDGRAVYVMRPPPVGRARPLYLAYIVDKPRATDPEGIAGVIFPVAGGFADRVFSTTLSYVLVAKSTGRPVAIEEADQYPPSELQAAVRRAFRPRQTN